MSNQTEIKNALLNMPEVVFLSVNTSGTVKIKGHYYKIGKYWGQDKKTHDGYADIIGMLNNGKFFAIETKTKHEALSPDQITFLFLVKDSGGISGVARSAEDAIKIIRGAL